MGPNSEAVMAKKIKNENMTPTEKKKKRKTSISVENGDPIAENPAKKSKVDRSEREGAERSGMDAGLAMHTWWTS